MLPAPWSLQIWMPRKSLGSPIFPISNAWTLQDLPKLLPLPRFWPPPNHHPHKNMATTVPHPSRAKSTMQGQHPPAQNLWPSAHPPGACCRRTMPVSAHTAPAAATKPVCVPQTNTLPRTVGANIPPPQAPHSKKLSVHRTVREQGCHAQSMPRAHALSVTSTPEQTFRKVQLDCSPCCCGCPPATKRAL
jgi:hypothetical protein